MRAAMFNGPGRPITIVEDLRSGARKGRLKVHVHPAKGQAHGG